MLTPPSSGRPSSAWSFSARGTSNVVWGSREKLTSVALVTGGWASCTEANVGPLLPRTTPRLRAVKSKAAPPIHLVLSPGETLIRECSLAADVSGRLLAAPDCEDEMPPVVCCRFDHPKGVIEDRRTSTCDDASPRLERVYENAPEKAWL